MGAAAVALAAPASAIAAAPPALLFEAFRDGRRIGRQQTTFETAGPTGLVVRTVAEFVVKLGPLTLYRYRHEATERWADDRLERLDTRTNQNGRIVQVAARRTGDGIAISGASGASLGAPATASPLSHWNAGHARRPLFNPQDGKLLRVRVSGPAPASIRMADGSMVDGTKLTLRGDAEIEDFYDSAGVWAGLVGKLPDRSMLEYRRA